MKKFFYGYESVKKSVNVSEIVFTIYCSEMWTYLL